MQKELTVEEQSKDKFFVKLSAISEEMAEEHGKDFAMGALVMAAQWIARGETPGENPVSH